VTNKRLVAILVLRHAIAYTVFTPFTRRHEPVTQLAASHLIRALLASIALEPDEVFHPWVDAHADDGPTSLGRTVQIRHAS
jgi:hypothetical protein